jgi:hypothetical protein
MKNIHEIVTEVQNAKTIEDKMAVLWYNKSYALKSVLKGIYDPNVRFCFESIPPYKQSDAPIGLGYTTINTELGRAYIFEVGNPRTDPNLKHNRKIQILIQMLEAMEAKEAEIFCQMLLKKPIPGITAEMVHRTFPDILSALPTEEIQVLAEEPKKTKKKKDVVTLNFI